MCMCHGDRETVEGSRVCRETYDSIKRGLADHRAGRVTPLEAQS